MDSIKNDLITGLVLARGGSVSIPHKNLQKLGAETLLARCIHTMIKSCCLTSVWVSTDDAEICRVASGAGARVHWRAPYTATHDASSLTAVQEFLQLHEEFSGGVVCLVQCTSPFLKPQYLKEAVQLLSTHDSVFAAFRSHSLRWAQKNDGNGVEPLNLKPGSRPCRQHWSGDLCEAGMFYLTPAFSVIQHGLLQAGRIGVVEIEPEDALDIDTPLDLLLAHTVLKYKKESSEDQGDGCNVISVKDVISNEKHNKLCNGIESRSTEVTQ